MAESGSFLGDLRAVLRGRDFRRLFLTRLVSQTADGVFQVGLAGVIFFSPERGSTPGSIAAAFTVAVLPYTLLGPFAGVLLDHWRRRQVLVVANAARAVMVTGTAVLAAAGVVGAPLYLVVLACMSVNRFFLAGLGASLPHVVDGERLVMANSVSPTSGAVTAIAGGVLASVLRVLAGPGDGTDGMIVALAGFGYLAAAALAARMPVELLGPAPDRRLPWSGVRGAALGVLHGLVAAAGHLRRRRTATAALGVTVVVRFGYGVSTLMTILMCRNLLADPADVGTGLGLLTVAFAATGVGFVLAAFLTPVATRRMSPQQWIVVSVLLAGGVDALLVAGITVPGLVAAAGLVGVATQGGKICVDALVQAHVDDDFRGRAFSLYDVLFNASFVAAAGAAAAVLPPTGYSRTVVGALAVVHLLAALGYARADRSAPARTDRGHSWGTV